MKKVLSSSNVVVLVFILAGVILAGCSKGFNEKTGVYKGSDITITFPKGWKKAKTVPNAAITVADPEGNAQMTFFVQKVPENMTLEDFLKMVSSRTLRAGVQEQDRGEIEIDGIQGQWVKRSISVGGQNFQSIMYYVMKDQKIYSLMGIAPTDSFSEWEPVFDEVAEGMTFD